MKKTSRIAALLILLITLLPFQNCQNASGLADLSSKNSSSDQSSTDGNGQPYDGKIFVTNKSCADGTQVESRLVLAANFQGATLYRQDCKTADPTQIAVQEIKFDSQNASILFYNDQEFKMEKPAIQLPGLVSWFYQLTGLLQARPPSIYIIDMFEHSASKIKELKNSGHTVICSVSAGTVENWNADANRFPAEAIGQNVSGSNSEKWLDTRNTAVRSIMLARLDLARDKGCHGIDFDNVDGFTNATGFSLTKENQLEYNQYLAFAAHDRYLILSLNNVPELAPIQANIFDFAIAEDCFKYNECSAYQAFIQRQKPVLAAEYGPFSESQCMSAQKQFISLAFFDSKLDGTGYQACALK